MFVCLCKGITDTQIKASVLAGARSLADVRSDIGVATQCCKCLPETYAIINQAIEQHNYPSRQQSTTLFYSA